MKEFPIDEHDREEYMPRTRIVIDEYPVMFDVKTGEEADEDDRNERTIPQPGDLLCDCISRRVRAENAKETVVCGNVSKSGIDMNAFSLGLCILAMLGIVGILLRILVYSE